MTVSDTLPGRRPRGGVVHRLGAIVGVLVATVALVVLPAGPASAGPGEGEFLDRLNAARAAVGLPGLAVSPDLTSVAQVHSARMAAQNRLYHNPNLATDVSNWLALGENVGYGGSVLTIHNALYASAPHRANMLNSGYTQVGIGTAVSGDGRLWVTQVFRKPTAAAAGFPLVGVIGATYPSVSRVLGLPTSAEYDVRGGRGQAFQHGEMLWSWPTGARELHGAILSRYRALGGTWSPLGLPTTHEMTTADGRGRYNHFQGGSVFWSPWTGAHEVRGAIRDRWARAGWERGVLRYPVTDELGTPDRLGRFSVFEGGSVYWSPWTGAREVRGAIRDAWGRLGWERGLGYPVSDEYSVPGGRRSDFERGSIFWDARTGRTHVV